MPMLSFSPALLFKRPLLLVACILISVLVQFTSGQDVVVETIAPGDGPLVNRDNEYNSMVTLYIENDDKTRTPSGWSTRKEDGAAQDKPFVFRPGKNLIEGWTEGVLKMKEGERALLHVPSKKGYGSRPMGSKGGAFYIPGNSNLLFDIEIIGKVSSEEL